MTNPKDRVAVSKVPLHLIPASAQIQQALGHLEGACKYGPFNWRTEPVSASVYISAAMRHIQKWWEGQDLDKTNGVVHNLGHAIAGLAILIDAQVCGTLIDDRPPASPTPELMDDAQAAVNRILELFAQPVKPLTAEQKAIEQLSEAARCIFKRMSPEGNYTASGLTAALKYEFSQGEVAGALIELAQAGLVEWTQQRDYHVKEKA